jgi:hypothetical protein
MHFISRERREGERDGESGTHVTVIVSAMFPPFKIAKTGLEKC